MGCVYLVRHAELGVERALKVMAKSGDAQLTSRFQREAQNLARVDHPNVVRIHECGEVGGQPWFAMDRVEGESLDGWLRRERPAWERAVAVALAITRGVGALHREGIVHRDLKPQNVMMTADGRPVVIDLGLAVAPERDQRLTATGAIVGTLSYMPPEQFDGTTPTPRTDVYALGLIVFELLTGRRAIEEASSVQATTSQIVAGTRPRPSRLNPALPLRLDDVCLRAMARDPDRRQADAEELAADLARVLERPGWTRRAVRAITGGLIGVGALAGLAAFVLTRSPAPPAAGKTDGPAKTVPRAAPAGLSTRQIEAGARALRVVRGDEDPRRRYEGARAWLAKFPGHPAAPEAVQLREEARLRFPSFRATHRGVLRGALLAGRVLTCGMDGTARLWDRRTGKVVRAWPVGFGITGLAVAPDETTFVVGGVGGRLAWIDLQEGRVLARQRRGKWKIHALAFDRSGERLACGIMRHVEVFRFPEFLRSHRLGPHKATIWNAAFTPDGAALVTACGLGVGRRMQRTGGPADQRLRVFDLATGQASLTKRFGGKPQCAAISPDGKRIAVGTSAGRIFLLGVSGGERELHAPDLRAGDWANKPNAHNGGVRGVAFSPDGTLLYSVSDGAPARKAIDPVRVWEVGSGKQVRTLAGKACYLGLAGGTREVLLWAGGTGQVEVWGTPR